MNDLVAIITGRKVATIFQVIFFMGIALAIGYFLNKLGQSPLISDLVFALGVFIILSCIITSCYMSIIAFTYNISFYQDYFVIQKGFSQFILKLDDIVETRINNKRDSYVIIFFLNDETQYKIKSINYNNFEETFTKLASYYENGWQLG
ncbi:MAG: hypothetical protein ACRCTA_01400 [Bacilli bacterium]